jgi:hypothetical protein
MTQNQKTVQPASPLAMRTLGKAFLSVGHKRGIQSFVESGESLLDSADELDPPPTQAIEKSGKWIFETIFLASVGCVVTILLGWLVDDYWSAAWWMAPIFIPLAWLPWSIESAEREKQARDAFFRNQEWLRERPLR